MDPLEINENICRICLGAKVTINWNEEIFDLCGMTYKDCYYKYTHLVEGEKDPFSFMLCKTCSEELKNVNILIERALESFRILQQTYYNDFLICEELKVEKSSCTTTKQELEQLENCLLSQSTESLIEMDCGSKEELIDLENAEAYSSNDVETLMDSMDDINPQSSQNHDWPSTKDHKVDNTELIDGKNKNNETSSRSRRSKRKIIKPPDEEDIPESPSSPEDKRIKTKKEKILMCAYCSLIIADVNHLKKHEETHDINRERKETCPHCGLKFFNKMTLKSHMMIHKENREKKKCEFCDKAYFNRGALNVHRRIHLGLTKKCTFCSKEFCRQYDLDRHLSNHSAIPLLSQPTVPKYVVHCKDCDTQIPIKRWLPHKAAHKNEPQMKCKICNRDFFSRKNCTKHIRNMHKKNKGEYDTYIHYYVNKSKTRVSHLMLQQNETVQPV